VLNLIVGLLALLPSSDRLGIFILGMELRGYVLRHGLITRSFIVNGLIMFTGDVEILFEPKTFFFEILSSEHCLVEYTAAWLF
jgi:hypothetical protein